MFKPYTLNPKQSGQIMLISVLAMAGILLGVTVIGGLLMTYQIRQASGVTNSTKAIMAADAGIEWELYKLATKNPNYPLTFSNNARVETKCEKSDGNICTYSGIESVSIESTGESFNVYRALTITLAE